MCGRGQDSSGGQGSTLPGVLHVGVVLVLAGLWFFMWSGFYLIDLHMVRVLPGCSPHGPCSTWLFSTWSGFYLIDLHMVRVLPGCSPLGQGPTRLFSTWSGFYLVLHMVRVLPGSPHGQGSTWWFSTWSGFYLVVLHIFRVRPGLGVFRWTGFDLAWGSSCGQCSTWPGCS